MSIRKFFILCLVMIPFVCFAQNEQVSWRGEYYHADGDKYTLIFIGTIQEGWHIYGCKDYGEDGPTTTSVTFKHSGNYSLDGELRVISPVHKEYSNGFNAYIETISGIARLEQDIILEDDSAEIIATIEYMACMDGACTPPEEAVVKISVKAAEPVSHSLSNNQENIQTDQVNDNASAHDVISPESATHGQNTVHNEDARITELPSSGTMWALIIEAIIWGFAALLTPCVFPMVPMTVSFFMHSYASPAKARISAALYGLFIVLLYTLPIAAIIAITYFIGGDAVSQDIFNWIATHWFPNLLFFFVFMTFAASFFGAFEITLPSWMINSSDSKSEKGGIAGIFFMALTLVLVSFSCTGPIVSSVLIKSTSGEFWSPILTMLAFSLAFALPFTIFAFFPSLLSKLPKSGGWLNSVKVVLGFIEIALGLKFLSVADQVYHWGILDREIYLAIWIVTFTLLGLYFLGKIRFEHDSKVENIGVGRLFLAIITFTFVVYLIPGMWGAPLKGISGYLPPLESQDFVSGLYTPSVNSDTPRKYSNLFKLPKGIDGYFDIEEAKAEAERSNKPLFIDFTGHGCVNCREMEARVWSNKEVQRILREKYVVVALYTDDKLELPEEEWVTTPQGKVLKTIGKINAYYALSKFGATAQPYYVILGKNDELLAEPRGYDLNVDSFIEFLNRGADNYIK